MKRIFLAATVLLLSAGLTLSAHAQTKAVNIENFSTNISDKIAAAIVATPVYNKAGKLMYTVKRYQSESLPKNVRRMVENEFEDYNIAGVEEIVLPSDNNSIYLVHIANDKKLETVRVYKGESEVIKEYKKG